MMERISIATKGDPPLAVRYPRSDGQVCQKFRGKLFFQRNLCYHASHKTIWLREDEPSMSSPWGERSSKPCLDCGGQGCCISSAYAEGNRLH